MIWFFGLLVILLLIVAAVQRSQISRLTKESAYWENQAAEALLNRYESQRRLLEIAKICTGVEPNQ